MFRIWLLNIQNRWSALRHGWGPSWFGTGRFDKTLVQKIKTFQNKQGLKITGKCDVITYRLLLIRRWRRTNKIKQRKTNYKHGHQENSRKLL